MYCIKGCGFWSVRYVEVKIILRCPFRSEILSTLGMGLVRYRMNAAKYKV